MRINPETAEVMWIYARKLECCVDGQGDAWKKYFARAPGSDEWISFDDLPDEISMALGDKYYEDEP